MQLLLWRLQCLLLFLWSRLLASLRMLTSPSSTPVSLFCEWRSSSTLSFHANNTDTIRSGSVSMPPSRTRSGSCYHTTISMRSFSFSCNPLVTYKMKSVFPTKTFIKKFLIRELSDVCTREISLATKPLSTSSSPAKFPTCFR